MKYIIKFSKTGTICYTSHLDIMKVFKRSFKRAGISLAYSQGFNPHPKMGFAQPLSLGYSGLEEYIEFELAEKNISIADEQKMLKDLSDIMPQGLKLMEIKRADWLKKTLAAETVAASYLIEVALNKALELNGEMLWHEYMDRDEIIVLKKQKKKPEPVEVDIKSKIRNITFTPMRIEDGDVGEYMLYIDALLDSGSESNLSPELILSGIPGSLGLDFDRADVNIVRKKIIFSDEIDKYFQ